MRWAPRWRFKIQRCGAVARLVSLHARMALRGRFSSERTREDGSDVYTTSIGAMAFCITSTCRAELEAWHPALKTCASSIHCFMVNRRWQAGETASEIIPRPGTRRRRALCDQYRGAPQLAKAIAKYIIFLAENTGLVQSATCARAGAKLQRYTTLEQMLGDI